MHIGGGFDRFDNASHIALRKTGARRGEIDKHNVAQGVLRVLGDAHESLIAFDAHPRVFCVVFVHGLHPAVVGTAAAFGRDPNDVLRGIFDVASFAMHTVLRIDLQAV